MIDFALKLKSAPAAIHPAVAWFIPGSDSAVWIDEICRWGLPTSGLRLYVLPASSADRSPVGVLVVTPPDTTPNAVRRAQPYGRLARRLYLPVDAQLWPPVSDTELLLVLKLPVQVFHPSIGLIGFEEKDVLRVHDLLAVPVERRTDWGRAVAGDNVTPRIRSVVPLHPPAITFVLEQGRDDIGGKSPGELPRNPNESPIRDLAKKAIVAPAVRAANAAISPLKWMAWLSEKLAGKTQPPTTRPAPSQSGVFGGGGFGSSAANSGPNWARRLYIRLSSRLEAVARNLDDQRRESLERLKRMLADDPDEGLRHAISLRQISGRGVDAPSAGLPTKDVRFDLSSLVDGAGPTDGWDIPAETTHTLTQQYRQAANRELRLGRYLRAAYIFGELLGDYASAANALEQGRHFRDAAVLYRDKLANPRRAATCLQSGGLLADAAAVWFELREFETAGDLYARIEQPDEAARCYRKAVLQAVAKPDPLSAAKLLETKLEVPDEALAVLQSAWPGDPAASRCLTATFDLLSRLGRHDVAAARVTSLRKESPPSNLKTALIEALGSIATGYPDRDVRHRAADATRVAAARWLPSESASSVKQIAHALARLVPEDRLLMRDASRYLEQPRSRSAKADTGICGVVVLRQFHLPGGVRWAAATRFDGGYCAIGWDDKDTAMVVGETWSGSWAATQRSQRLPSTTDVQLLHVPGHDLVLTPSAFEVGGRANLDWYTSAGSGGRSHTLTILRPSWLTDYTSSIAVNERGVVWEFRFDGDIDPVLAAYNVSGGELLSSHTLPGLDHPQEWRSAMVAVRDEVYLAWGRAVLCFVPIMSTRVDPTDSLVTGLVASHGRRDRKVVATMEQGCLLLGQQGQHQSFAKDFPDPIATFLRSDKIVVIAGRRGRVYGLKDRREPYPICDFSVNERPLVLFAADQLDQFAIVSVDGTVTTYQAPA